LMAFLKNKGMVTKIQLVKKMVATPNRYVYL